MKIVVVGCGIVGLAAARQASISHPGAEVVAIEKEAVVAAHQSSHNSGVVHAGLYYPPGSLKARLCRRGTALLRDFCRERGLAYEECGKLVVATSPSELARLDRLEQRGRANEVPGLARLGRAEIAELEPHVSGLQALHSPATAIADFAAIARGLEQDLIGRGARIRLCSPVARVRPTGDGAVVELADGQLIAADRVLVCAGLGADRLAAASGEPLEPRIVPFRGEYWRLVGASAELVKGLIYPVPDPDLPFLGIHLTRTVGGDLLAGPSALLALDREGYGRWAFSRSDTVDSLRWPGTWRVFGKHWRTGLAEMRRALSKRVFIAEARRFVPDLRLEDAVRATTGIRAQAVDRDGGLVDDFRLGGDGRIVWVRNAPSPGATSSFAIAEGLIGRLKPL